MTSKFTVIILATEPGLDLPDLVWYRDVTNLREGFDLNAFKQEINSVVDDAVPGDKVTSSRIVVVLSVDEEVNRRFLEDVAETVPNNGVYASKVEAGQEFTSARAASLHLGLKNNEVALYLNKNKHLPPDERKAKLRGVTLAYREDYHQALLGDLRD